MLHATAGLKATVRQAWEGRPVSLVSPDTGQDRWKARAFLVIRLAGRRAGEFAIDHCMLAFHSGPAHAGFRPFTPACPYADGSRSAVPAPASQQRMDDSVVPSIHAPRSRAGLLAGVIVISAGRTARHAQPRLYYDDGMSQFSAALRHSPISRLLVSSARAVARVKRGMDKLR